MAEAGCINANRARALMAELLRQPADEEPIALARADEALFALHQAGFDLVAVAGAGHVEDVPLSASEPNRPKTGR